MLSRLVQVAAATTWILHIKIQGEREYRTCVLSRLVQVAAATTWVHTPAAKATPLEVKMLE